MTMADFSGKVVVITGAIGGIGIEACELFAAAGARVVAVDRQEDKGGALAQRFAERGLAVEFRVADVADPVQVSCLAHHVRRRHGQVDVLLNNAGILSFSPILGTTVLEWDRVQDVNCKSAFLMIRAIAPLMTDGGVILNMSSSAATKPTANTAAYSIAKAGVVVLTQIAALELGPKIRVNAILPGPLDTQMPHKYLQGHPHKDQIMADMVGRTIVKRLGLPREVAETAVFLASDAASYINGAAIAIDGGFIG